MFEHLAEGVDDGTGCNHLQRGKYSKRLKDKIQDQELAAVGPEAKLEKRQRRQKRRWWIIVSKSKRGEVVSVTDKNRLIKRETGLVSRLNR